MSLPITQSSIAWAAFENLSPFMGQIITHQLAFAFATSLIGNM